MAEARFRRLDGRTRAHGGAHDQEKWRCPSDPTHQRAAGGRTAASVRRTLAELPADMRARLTRVSELIESVGLPNVKEPHVRHMRGPLWEIRLKGKAGIARALYVTAKEQRVVILSVFIKKTEKTPLGEIHLALQRAKELKP
jgi:phage-related protein